MSFKNDTIFADKCNLGQTNCDSRSKKVAVAMGEISPVESQHWIRPSHRGRKAAIQLWDDDDGENDQSMRKEKVMIQGQLASYGHQNANENGNATLLTASSSKELLTPSLSEPHQLSRNSANRNQDEEEKDERSNRTTEGIHIPGKSVSSRPRFKSFMGRLVSNPFVSFLTCSGDIDDDELVAVPPPPSSSSRGSLRSWLFRATGNVGRGHYAQFFQRAIRAGAPKAIVQTMKQFPYQGRIQRLGCGALKDMAMDSWHMKTQIVEAAPGSVETILKAMRIHLKDAKLQEIACACLYQLVAGDLPKVLLEKGIVGTLLTTMEHHAQDEDVLPIACDVLLALTDHGPSAIEILRQRLGGVVLAKLEHTFRGRNQKVTKKSGELLKRLYL